MMSAGGKVVRSQKEKLGKMNSSSQNGKPETTQTSKVQPTAEQVRLAQILSDRSEGDPEIAAKVNQIIDLTGRSSDEVMTVLYDCDYDINRTVEKLLESQETLADEWQVIDKKKKIAVPNKGSPSETPSDVKFENTTETEFVINHIDGFQRGRGVGRGGLRFPRGRGRASWSDRTERSRDNTSYERETRYEPNRGHRRGNYGEPRGRGGRRGGRSLHSNKFETQIDTWTSESMPNGEDNSRFGSWTDVADEWTADEWNGSLNESCVFTPSVSSHSAKIYSDPNNTSDGKLVSAAHQGTTMTFESSNRVDQSGLSGDMMAAVSGTLFTSAPDQDSIGQHYVAKGPSLPSSVSEVGNCYGNISDRTTYVNHYNREATECIKNVMGIGRSSLGQGSSLRDEMVRSGSHQPQVTLQQSSSTHIQGVKQARPRLPPPSKIPSMPVEMPDSMNSGRLDVQFGSWDSMPAATDASPGFISDAIPPEYKGPAKISSSQAPSNSGTNVATRPMLSAYDPNASKAQAALSDSRVTPASKPNSFSSAALSGNNKGNESLHHMVASISSSSNDLLTSVTKPSGSAASQLGFIQMAYSSSSSEGGPASGTKLLLSNGPSHYGSSFGYHSGPTSLITMSSEYAPTPEHVQYTYGDSQRYGVGGPQGQQGFGSATFPPGYSAGPLPNQLHYGGSQGPAAKLFTPEKQGTGTYSVGSDVSGLYVDKQGTPFSASLSQSYDSASVYQSAGGFQGAGQPSSISLSYPGMASGLSFQGMQMDSSGFDAGQYPGYRQKEGPAGYEAAVASDGQRNAATSGIVFSGVQVQTSQSFSSNFGPGSGQNQVTQSTSVSSFIGQSTPPANATQGQVVPSAGSFANQRLSSSAGPGFANHAGPSQSFGGQVEGSQSTSAVAPSGLASSLVSSSTTGGKLSDSVSKLNLKDGQPGDPGAPTTSVDSAGMSASGVATPGGSTVVASSVAGMMTLASKMSLSTTAKTSLSQSKPLANMASGMASGAAAMLNHNYMIGQPPGFQLATFGYPATQQPLTYSSFEELQMLQQRFTNPMPYYEMALQTSAALPSRESAGPLGAQSYTGNDMKLAAMDVLSPVNAQPNQQPQTVTGNQQAFINHALHPAAAYSYYYPGPTGILPYYPMVPMAAIPSVSNPTFAGTTSTTQYQKPAVFGSHAYAAMGGQAQDFTKTFGTSQVPNKPSAGMATGMNAASGDLITGATGFGKTHIQTFERGGFHGGTPPPAFSMALPGGGTQAAGALGAPTVYGPPYVPIVPHQQSHSQLLHHAVPQDSAVAGRPVPPAGMQQKMSGSKTYNAAYWGSN